MNKKFDYLVVGAGIYGATFARIKADEGAKVLVLDRRPFMAGNCYTKLTDGIHVHKFGPHIFHTNSKRIWSFVNRFAKFNSFINSPLAYYEGQVYSLPINLLTLNKLWGVNSPKEAKLLLEQKKERIEDPKNLKEWALSQVGEEIYYKFFHGYTKKQWGRDPELLPASIIKRLPIRFTFDNNYYNAKYQGVPLEGYTSMVANMLASPNITLKLHVDFDGQVSHTVARKTLYTGSPDLLFDYQFGDLEYRSLSFDEKTVDSEDLQGNAIINYTSESVKITRSIEHKHFTGAKSDKTIISHETPVEWSRGKDRYYPIPTDDNLQKYAKYKKLANKEGVLLGGRLGSYKYWDMDQAVGSAINEADKQIN